MILTAELRDGDSTLHLDGPSEMVAELRERYLARIAAETLNAGDVTTWLARTLRDRCGAARYAVGYYLPAGGREIAERLVAAMSVRWGAGWASPLLPVASGPELVAGLARGFFDEISRVAGSLATAREAARAASPPASEISAAIAARLLRDLGDVSERADAYRVLVGADALAPAVAELARLHAELTPLADGASVRFALLELDDSPAEIAASERVSPAIRAAEVASEARRAEAPAATPAATPAAEAERDTYRAALAQSGMTSEKFRAACEAYLSEDRSPAAWVRAAQIVTRPSGREIELD
ncbi:MAG: hypothetical protein Q8S00_32290 [Deltaproteobacteria bacterium]|nr:hypothetical protein [Deltaproteobacteria bacterium]